MRAWNFDIIRVTLVLSQSPDDEKSVGGRPPEVASFRDAQRAQEAE